MTETERKELVSAIRVGLTEWRREYDKRRDRLEFYDSALEAVEGLDSENRVEGTNDRIDPKLDAALDYVRGVLRGRLRALLDEQSK
jgi:hypothetical protein